LFPRKIPDTATRRGRALRWPTDIRPRKRRTPSRAPLFALCFARPAVHTAHALAKPDASAFIFIKGDIVDELAKLQEQRNKLAADIRTHADEKFHKNGKKWSSPEDRQAWDKLNTQYNETIAQIDELRSANDVQQRLDDLKAAEDRAQTKPGDKPGREDRQHGDRDGADVNGRQGVTEDDRALALQAWCRYQIDGDISKAQRDAAKRCGLNPRAKELRFDLFQTPIHRQLQSHFRNQHPSVAARALSVSTGTAGGYTVPEGFIRQLEVNMLSFSGILQAADVMLTDQGNEMPWPTADDTGNEGEIVGENQAQSEADPTFAGVIFRAYKFSSKMVRVPVELLEDSAFDMAMTLGSMLGERLGRASNRKFTLGTGASEPKGIVQAASQGKETASSTAIADTELVELIHSVDPAYRAGAAFMAHDQIYLVLRLLKGTDGHFLWADGLTANQPDRLLGYPALLNQHMSSSVAAGNRTMLFGQMTKYKVRRVRGIRLRRLVERYADQDQEGFVAFVRQDGNLLDAGTAPVKYLRQKP
jgi:HK97 family phage major capsid protein